MKSVESEFSRVVLSLILEHSFSTIDISCQITQQTQVPNLQISAKYCANIVKLAVCVSTSTSTATKAGFNIPCILSQVNTTAT